MGHFCGELCGRVSSKFKLMISIVTILVIGLESVHALESAAGRRVSDIVVEATSVPQRSSLSDLPRALPTSSNERSRSVALPERVAIVADELSRRELLSAALLYIGYGVLTASHVPCPPRSGRSYYTPNCHSASGPVRPYSRGCSRISRCARG